MRFFFEGFRLYSGEGPVNMLISDGTIEAVGADVAAPVDATCVDARGLTLTPGLCDMHVHLRTPGFEEKENLDTGTRAALAGGITTVACMPNTRPTLDTVEKIRDLEKRIAREAHVEVAIISAISKDLLGRELVDMAAIAPYAAAYSDDGRTTEDPEVMAEALRFSKETGRLLITHTEDHQLAKAYVEVPTPPEVEVNIVRRDLELLEAVGGHMHIAHLSTAEGLALARASKSRGSDVTWEFCPHHLLLETDALPTPLTGFHKVNPPIRSSVHRRALIASLGEGTLFASDHAPHTRREKEGAYADTAYGFTGLELLFPSLYTHLVKEGVISMKILVEGLSSLPRKRLGLEEKATIEGAQADFVLWDLENPYEVKGETFESKGKITPLEGQMVYGKAMYVFTEGELKVKEGVVRC